jgi:hypothetical protein
MTSNFDGSETTLSYQRMVERYPNLKEEVGGFESQLKIPSLPDGKLVSLLCFGVGLSAFCIKKKERKENIQLRRSQA